MSYVGYYRGFFCDGFVIFLEILEEVGGRDNVVLVRDPEVTVVERHVNTRVDIFVIDDDGSASEILHNLVSESISVEVGVFDLHFSVRGFGSHRFIPILTAAPLILIPSTKCLESVQ